MHFQTLTMEGQTHFQVQTMEDQIVETKMHFQIQIQMEEEEIHFQIQITETIMHFQIQIQMVVEEIHFQMQIMEEPTLKMEEGSLALLILSLMVCLTLDLEIQ